MSVSEIAASFEMTAGKKPKRISVIAAWADQYRTKLDVPDDHISSNRVDEHSCNKAQFAHAVAWMTCCLFSIGTIIMLLFYITMAGNPNRPVFVGTFFVCAIASCAYFAKCIGMGDVTVFETQVPLARYVDWIATTPIMLYELCHIGGATFDTMMMVVGCDLLMLSCGILAACLDRTSYTGVMMVWFSLGCFFYGLMVYTLHTEVAQGTALDQSEIIQELFHYLEALTLTMWSFYPIVVFLGRAQCHLISKPMEDAILCILDCLAKLGMEGLVVVYIGFLSTSSSSSSSGH